MIQGTDKLRQNERSEGCERRSSAESPGTREIGAVPPSAPEDIGNPDFCSSIFGNIHTATWGGDETLHLFSPSHHPQR